MKQLFVVLMAILVAAVAFSAPAEAGTATVPPSLADNSVEDSIKFDLNSVTEEELISLSGIGPVLAHRIIELRAKKGGFASLEELLQVQGIGDTNISRFRDHLYLESTSPQAVATTPASQ